MSKPVELLYFLRSGRVSGSARKNPAGTLPQASTIASVNAALILRESTPKLQPEERERVASLA